jgi:hypothetical protein
VFFGKVADNNDMKIKEKFFCGEIQRDLDELADKRKRWQDIPRFTDFGEEDIRSSVMGDPEGALTEYFTAQIKAGFVVYHDDDIPDEVTRRISLLSADERNELLEQIVTDLVNDAVKKRIAENFKRVQADVKGIIARECWLSQEIHQPENNTVDPRMVDPLYDF